MGDCVPPKSQTPGCTKGRESYLLTVDRSCRALRRLGIEHFHELRPAEKIGRTAHHVDAALSANGVHEPWTRLPRLTSAGRLGENTFSGGEIGRGAGAAAVGVVPSARRATRHSLGASLALLVLARLTRIVATANNLRFTGGEFRHSGEQNSGPVGMRKTPGRYTIFKRIVNMLPDKGANDSFRLRSYTLSDILLRVALKE